MATRRNVQVVVAEITAAGDTTVVAAAVGKQHRIMGYSLGIGGDAFSAAGGAEVLKILDVTTLVGELRTDVGTAVNAGVGEAATGWVNLGDGYLCTTTNGIIKANLNTALTGGAAVVTIAYVDE